MLSMFKIFIEKHSTRTDVIKPFKQETSFCYLAEIIYLHMPWISFRDQCSGHFLSYSILNVLYRIIQLWKPLSITSMWIENKGVHVQVKSMPFHSRTRLSSNSNTKSIMSQIWELTSKNVTKMPFSPMQICGN